MWIFHEDFLDITKEEQNIPSLLRASQENNFGRVYLYSNEKLISVRFSSTFKWVDEYEDYETGETYGGYLKKYKEEKLYKLFKIFQTKKYGIEIYTTRSKWIGGKRSIGRPSGYLVAKFYDIIKMTRIK